MKLIRPTAMLLAATAFGATMATAQAGMDQPQTTPQQTMPQQTTPPPATTPDTTAAPLTNADVTDSDVNQFATAVVAVQAVQSDPSITDTDKQTKMADAVKQAGMTPEKFNAIAKASQSDPALMKRIQTAAAAQMQAAPAGTTDDTGGNSDGGK